jgi:mono/diheme cytochrome c family protein
VIVFTLSTENKLGLGLVALAWVVFSLVVSMVVPRYRPGFPGKNLPAFLALTALFFVAMLGAVAVFGKESKESELGVRGGAEPGAPAQTQTGVTSTTATGSATTVASGGGGGANLAAGKAAWDKASCGGCHVMKAADGAGTVGPNLDETDPKEQEVARQVENGGGGMPPFKGILSAQEIADVSAYVAQVAGSTS